MKALSIRQPWAWMIRNCGKDIENRGWSTNVRGRVLIHASASMTRTEYDDARLFTEQVVVWDERYPFPKPDELEYGGIIGSVEIVDCVRESSSFWFNGPFGFVLRAPRPLPFIPFRGQLGFFHVPDALIKYDHPCTCVCADCLAAND